MKKFIHSEQHKRFCEFMIKARKDSGLTQQDLAHKIGRPQSFVAKYEGGERRLDIIELNEIAKYIDLDIDSLINELRKF